MDIIHAIRKITGFIVGTETPYLYESKQEHYEKRAYPVSLRHFKSFFDVKSDYVTNNTISFRKIPFDVSSSFITNKLNSPRWVIKKVVGGLNYEILFYKELIGKNFLVSQVHILDGVYFYASFSVNGDDKESINTVKRLVLEKYDIPADILTNDTLCISDSFNNKIICEKDVYYRFGYFTGNEQLLNKLKRTIDTNENQQGTARLIVNEEIIEALEEI